MTRHFIIFFLIFFLLALTPLSAQQTTGSTQTEIPRKGLHPDAPPETQILSQIFGEWDAYQVRKNRDGTWSTDTTHYEWRWYSILDGHAIQDDWFKFEGSTGSVQTPHIVGTNIRIYNASEKQWHMAWIDKTNRKLATFTARNENNMVIMSGKNARGREVKNTFFNLSKDTFDWKQEWTFDGGNSWVEVSQIHCKRQKDNMAAIR